MLQIPALDGIPRSFKLVVHNRLAIRTALALLDAGAIPAAASPNAPVGDVIRLGLRNWLDARTDDIRRFNFRIDCQEFDATNGFERQRVMRFDFSSWNRNHFVIGPAVTRCEKAITGLGQATLHWLDVAGQVIPLFDPPGALRLASWNYWQGCLDEREAVEELKLNGEDTDHIFTRADFDRYIPRWASSPKKTLNQRALQQLANPRRTTITGRVARALLALINALAQHRRRVQFYHQDLPILPFALLLRWSAKDRMPQIFDDWANEAYQHGEYREDLSQAAIGDDEESIPVLRKFFKGLEPVFPIARAVEGVLDALLIDRPRTLAEVFRGE